MTFPLITASSWTPEEDAKLVRLWNDGLSASRIARELKRPSRSAVIGRVFRLRQQGVDLRTQPPTRTYSRTTLPLTRTTDRTKRERLPKEPKAREYRPGGFSLAPMNRTSEPLPPREAVRARAFAPLPGVEPVPFLSRRSRQCSWPVGGEYSDMMVCGCEVPDDGGPHFCPTHREAARNRTTKRKDAQELIRELRRYAA